jgi:hypothetical protein
MTSKAGRPPIAKQKQRHIILTVKLLPEEDAEIKSAISATSDKKSVWVRKALLNQARGIKSNT